MAHVVDHPDDDNDDVDKAADITREVLRQHGDEVSGVAVDPEDRIYYSAALRVICEGLEKTLATTGLSLSDDQKRSVTRREIERVHNERGT